jgi:hypothetical protein
MQHSAARMVEQQPLVLSLSDGNQATVAFQTGAIQALHRLQLLMRVQVSSGSGVGAMLQSALLKAVCAGQEANWSRAWTVAMMTPSDHNVSDASATTTTAVDRYERDGRSSPESLLSEVSLVEKKSAQNDEGKDANGAWKRFEQWSRNYCCTNFERELWLWRLRSPCRWFSSNVVSDWRSVIRKRNLWWTPRPDTCTEGPEDFHAPLFVYSAGAQACKDQQMVLYANSWHLPHHAEALGFRLCTGHGALHVPADLDDIAPPRVHDDPLAVRAGSVFAIRRRLAPKDSKMRTDHMLLIDGFSQSPMFSTQLSRAEQRGLYDQVGQLVRSPDHTWDDTRAYKARIVQMSSLLPCHDCRAKGHDSCRHVRHNTEQLAWHDMAMNAWQRNGHCGLSDLEYRSLLNIGYSMTLDAFSPHH